MIPWISYLAWKAREYDFSTRFIELAGEINLSMPYFVVQKAERILGLQGKSLRGSRVLVLGVTYKEDLPDMRESPALKVIQLFMKEGCEVEYYDPYVPSIEVQLQNQGTYEGRQSARLHSIPDLSGEKVGDADLVVVLTGHSCVDYELAVQAARAVLDTRNVLPSLGGSAGKVWPL